MKIKLLTLLALLLIFPACGKKGTPKPPTRSIPQAVSDLVVTQRGPRVLLSWGYPALTTAGTNLTGGIKRLVVYRYVEPLPVTLWPREPQTEVPAALDPTQPREIALFGRMPAVTPQQFDKLKTKLDSIEQANIPTYSVGAKIVYEDSPQMRTDDGRPVRIHYAVVTEGVDEKSALSNLGTVIPLEIAQAPTGFRAVLRPEAVVLEWAAPRKTITGQDNPSILGYNIYRLSPAGLGVPLNGAPIKETAYRDVPPYGEHRYVVTAVTSAGPPLVESEPSTVATVDYKDLLPPPVPANLNTLSEDRAVRLVWDAVEAGDLKGYLVYRESAGARTRLTASPITETNFRDATVPVGAEVTYLVTTVDQSGNESEPAKSSPVLIAR